MAKYKYVYYNKCIYYQITFTFYFWSIIMTNKENTPLWIIILFSALTLSIFIISFFVLPKYKVSNDPQLEKYGLVVGIDTGNINNNFVVNSQDFDITIGTTNNGEVDFIEECKPVNTWEYKILNVFDHPINSPLNPKDYISYTKPFTISWDINSAKLCIVSDVVDYRKKHQFTYSTYILFNDKWMDGHLNVGFSKKNNVIYDLNSSANEPFLDGRFRGDETPKIYSNINLSHVRVANFVNGWSKVINILERLQQEGEIRIWWFVNAKNGEWIIKKFIIAYKCEDWSDCKIE